MARLPANRDKTLGHETGEWRMPRADQFPTPNAQQTGTFSMQVFPNLPDRRDLSGVIIPPWWQVSPWVSAWNMFLSLPAPGRQDAGGDLPSASLIVMNPTVSEALQRLVQHGADSAFVTKVVDFCTQDPVEQCLRAILPWISREEFVRTRQAVLESWALLQRLEALVKMQGFAGYSAALKSQMAKERRRLRARIIALCVPVLQAIVQSETADPLLPLLELGRLPKPRRGKPSRPVVTFMILLLTDHLRANRQSAVSDSGPCGGRSRSKHLPERDPQGPTPPVARGGRSLQAVQGNS